jgi:hypothetical protein
MEKTSASNKRMAFTLISIAITFFVAIILKKIIFG